MPKAFDKMINSIKKNLKGKNNPRTNKPYTESEIFAIAVAQWKKTHGGKAPSREASPQWYCTDCGKEVRENLNLSWNEIIEYDKSNKLEFNEPLKISGMAINETITKNKIKYVAEELDVAAPSLIDKPILNAHNNESVENILGKVIDAEKVDKGIHYTAEIDSDEKKIINKIKKGYINKVSIGAHVKQLIKEEIEEDGEVKDVYLAKGIQFNELSLVPVPGDEDSSITLMHALSESFNDQGDSLSEELENQLLKEEFIMSEDKMKELEEKITSLVEENKQLKEEKAAEESKKQMKELKEQIKKEIMESLKEEDKETKEPKENKEEDKEDEKKEDEKKEEKDESKGLVEENEEEKEDEEKLDEETAKKMVIEQYRGGVSFYYKT